MNETQYISDFLAPRDAWDKLSIEEQAAMMKAAVSEGILDLGTIRQKYNEFAEGGNTDDDLVDWIIREEGFIANPRDIGDGKMTLGSGLTAQKWHDQYKRNGNKWTSSDNRRAVREEVANRRRWAEKNIPNWDSLPSSSQKALLSYKYNYDFNQANSPKLFKALSDSNLQEAARQMDATSSNPVFKKGLQDRRQREQEWFLRDVTSSQVPNTFHQPAVSTQVYNPYVQQVETTRMLPIDEPDPNNYIRTREVSPQEQRRRKFQENVEAFQRFNTLMDLIDLRNNSAHSYNPIYSLIGGDSDEYANGGKIYIKPENRGKFTALKERTGHSATWFKEHGTPAQKKMATFALNARHWKHEDGGNLYPGGGFMGLMPAMPGIIIDSNAAENIATTASKKVMNYIKGAHDTGSYFSYDPGMEAYTGPAQDTYLLPRRLQENEFLRRGYIKGKNKDYGLVKRAVGDRDLPVYQRNPDAISRDNLTVIGNVHGWDPWYGDSNTSLEHAGSYPTAVYIDREGNFYQKGWDLNDYGGKTGSTIGVLSDIVDRIGSPTVVTTGYQPVKDSQSERFIQEITPMMAKKGLVPTDVNGRIEWTLPDITVTGRKRKRRNK